MPLLTECRRLSLSFAKEFPSHYTGLNTLSSWFPGASSLKKGAAILQQYRIVRFLALAIMLLSLPVIAGAQSTGSAIDWETLRPDGEEFTIQMPKNSTLETSSEPYHKLTLNTRLYFASNPAGGFFAIVSMSGIKANPAL